MDATSRPVIENKPGQAGSGWRRVRAWRWSWLVPLTAVVAVLAMVASLIHGPRSNPSNLDAAVTARAASGPDCAATVPPSGEPLDTMASGAIAVGGSRYQTPGSSAYLLVLSRDCLTKQAFTALPTDSSLDSTLTADLAQYATANGQNLAVITGPAGSGDASTVLPHGTAFSYVVPVVSGLDDIRHIAGNAYGAVENIGHSLNESGAQAAAGELHGVLQRAGQGHPFSFVQTEQQPFATRASDTTRIDPTAEQPLAGYTYQMVSALSPDSGPDTVLAVAGGSESDGENAVIEPNTYAASQQWKLQAAPGVAGAFQIKNVNSGQCLNVFGGGTDPGRRIIQWPCVGDPVGDHLLNDSWRLVDRGDGDYAVANVATGMVLGTTGNAGAVGTVADQDVYRQGTEGQVWTFKPAGARTAAPRAHGIFVLANRGDDGRVLDVPAGSADSTEAQLSDETDLTDQRWSLEPDTAAGTGHFRLVSLASQRCLGAPDPQADQSVAQLPCGNASTSWQPVAGSDGSYAMQLGSTGLVLTTKPDSDQAVLAAPAATARQRWTFTAMVGDAHAYGVYALSSPIGLAFGPAADTPSSKIVMQPETEDASQQWVLDPNYNDTHPGSYQLVNVKTALCAHAATPIGIDGGQVTQVPCANNDDVNQLFYPERQSDGSYVLRSAIALPKMTDPILLGVSPSNLGSHVVANFSAEFADGGWDAGGATQWNLRPLSRTVTMTAGTANYSASFPLTYSGFVALAFDPAGRPVSPLGAIPYYTNTGMPAVNARYANSMVNNLRYFAGRPGTTVLVQSVKNPTPGSAEWGSIGAQLAALGGNAAVFDNLDSTADYGTAGYALVGCAGCAAGSQPETAGPGTDGALAGYLTRAADSSWRAGLSSEGGNAGFELSPLAAQADAAWPVPNTDPQRAALAWVSQKLGLGDPKAKNTAAYCYQPTTWNVRAEYCNTNVDWTGQAATLDKLSVPDGAGFTADDLSAVQTELSTEFTWVSQVRNFITNLGRVFADSQSAAGFNLMKVTSDVLTAASADGNHEVTSSVGKMLTAMLEGGGETILGDSPAKPLVGVIAAGYEVAMDVAMQDEGAETAQEFVAKASDLGADLADRFAQARDNLGLVLNLLVSDYTRLLSADLQVTAGDWKLGYPITSDLTKAMTLGTKQLMWTQLLPASKYDTELRITVPVNKSATDLVCEDPDVTGGHYYPFRDVPANAQLLVSNAWDASGSTTQHQAWVIGARKFPNQIWLEGTPASLVDPLFTKPADNGIGLSKTGFFSTAAFNVLDYTAGIPASLHCSW